MTDAPKSRSEKSIEEIYQKKTPLEHILCRPDTYVGSTEQQYDRVWVFDRKAKKMAFKDIEYVPGLYKIFDEILVNAADNFVRDPENMDTIDVKIDQAEGMIKVHNNGQGIPVQMHKEHQVYVPTLLFGELLTSDNYDDTEKKVTGGRNGYGAKLTNIFSKKFILETADSKRGLKFKQTWENNMSVKTEPEIEPYSGKDYTCVTFWPDLPRFNMEKLDDDIVDFMTKRVYDIAGTSQRGKKEGIKVFLNDARIKNLAGTKVKDFGDYVGLYLRSNDMKIHEIANDRWEFCISISEVGFNQVSFVNSICTNKGGTHVSHVADQVIAAILEKVNAKNKGGMEVKPFHVRNHLWIFVNCLIENPAFDSQTKDTLTTKQGKFGSRCEVSADVIQRVLKSGIVDTVLHWAKSKQELDMKKKLKATTVQTRCLGIPKLEDANDAGTKNGKLCTLILTEGDSAKSLAVAGLSVVGRNRYGVFPLKGKLLNVRDASYKSVTSNAEITNLLKILGLDMKKKYLNGPGDELRYGSIMIMADQDLDGSHIKGLLVNLFQTWWPHLFQAEGFLRVFATPIVKVQKAGSVQQFFTLQQYHQWADANNTKGWKTKYYKGLGTSTAAEAKDYFRKMQRHAVTFQYTGADCDEAIDLAFNKKRTDDRKGWINNANDEDFVDFADNTLSYTDFVAKELVHFSKYDVHRSIPSMVDGFKPTQRKVLFASFKRKMTSDVKVAQLVGYASEQTSYHHGEASLESTIVGMAQDFVGSNNINLLFPSGQFGTRAMGGKDSASSRYIYTRLNKGTRSIFHPSDDAVLKYLDDEGMSIEPEYYVPVLPMILVNGGDGIGTGWSCTVPNYNPRDILANLRRLLQGQELEPMHPWYSGFTGGITASTKGYEVSGRIEKTDDETIEITELPIRVWTQDYKEFLQQMLPTEMKPADEGAKKKCEAGAEGDGAAEAPAAEEECEIKIEDLREYHTENTVHFVITLTPEMMDRAEQEGLEKVFRIRKPGAATSNMVLFDGEGRVTKYMTPEEILWDFAAVRMDFYHKRKKMMCEKLLREKATLDNKTRFILMILNNELKLNGRKKKELVADLRKHSFPTSQAIAKLTMDAMEVDVNAEDEEPEEEDGEEETAGGAGYNYLLGMPLWSLTHEKVEAMKKQLAEKTAEYEELLKITTEVMWWNDLAEVEKTMDSLDATKAKAATKSAKLMEKARRKMRAENADLARKEAAKKAKEAQEAAEDEAMAQGADAERLTSVEERQKIQYFSQSFEKWLRAKVIAVAEDGQFMIDLKEGDWFTQDELTMEGSKFKGIPKVKPVQRDEFGKPISEEEAKAKANAEAVPVEEIEEESEAEEAEEEEEEKKGKKNAGAAKAQAAPAVVPELKPFVARPRPEDRFTYRSKLKAKEEKKQKGPSMWTQAFAAEKEAREAKREKVESQAEVRARRMAEREAAKAAREAAKLEEEARAADAPMEPAEAPKDEPKEKPEPEEPKAKKKRAEPTNDENADANCEDGRKKAKTADGPKKAKAAPSAVEVKTAAAKAKRTGDAKSKEEGAKRVRGIR